MSTWVLLRGLTRESRHWGSFPGLFKDAIPGARVLAPDLPGNGRLHGTRSPATVAAMAEYCRAELAGRGLPPPYHLVGLSLGAMVATAWAEGYPGEIPACVLINTSLRPFNPIHWRLRPTAWGELLKLASPGRPARGQEAAILRLTSTGAAAGRVLEDWIAYRRECPVSRGNALRQLAAALRYRAPAVRPAPAVLILASRRDALVDPRCSRRLAAAWGADLAEHPEAGHDLPLDDGPWVARQVSGWLRQQG